MAKTKIVTHDGGFHADDVFGVAALRLLLGEANVEIVRSRDQVVIDSGDYVLDTGYVYDPDKNRFDHHQKGGAGERENGIPYASFGLIWKQFGERIAGTRDTADTIDRWLVQPIDAFDNGVTLYDLTHPSKVQPLVVQSIFAALEPARGEAGARDDAFMEAVTLAQKFIERKIVHARAEARAAAIVREAYAAAPDKRIVIIDVQPTISRIVCTYVLNEYPDTVYFVRQHENGTWQVVCTTDPDDMFSRRKSLPEAWAGLQNEELAAVTGVSDAVFCHRGRFMAVAQSKEGALKLAQQALDA